MSNNLGNKEIMAHNIQYYMKLHKKSRNDMCEALGVKYTTFTDWVKGKSYPRIDKIELMANYFGINKSDLVENKTILDSTSNNYHIHCDTEQESNLILDYRKLSNQGKNQVSSYVQNLIALEHATHAINKSEEMLNAAHDQGATEEQKAHADSIMQDDSEWE